MGLKRLTTGVPGLDEILGGGLPEYSFNLLAGSPGCGKTTLVHQLTFENASTERPALYFTVVGEPPLKMLRYQQQMSFFDSALVGTAIRFIDLSPEVLTGDLARVLSKIVNEVERAAPAIVVVDSFRTVLRSKGGDQGLELSGFLQSLALHLTSWQVTSFLVGEYGEREIEENPVFTVADGILWLTQHRERNSMVRKLEVMKMRGAAALPGLHTFRISSAGIRFFPRCTTSLSERRRESKRERAAFGIAELDEMLGGGLPQSDATLITGPSGSGKTMLSTHFILEGIARGEPGVLAMFEEHPEDFLERARKLGSDPQALVAAGQLRLLYLRPLELSCDEILHQVQQCVQEIGAKRLVIDSLDGVELSLAPTFRDDFRESIYRLVGRLTDSGVNILLTLEVPEAGGEVRFSPHSLSFLAQNILCLRFVEADGRLKRRLTVVKMRRSEHSQELREYGIGEEGIQMLGSAAAQGPVAAAAPRRSLLPGLTVQEQYVFDTLSQKGAVQADELARSAALEPGVLAAALDRLRTLHYVAQVDSEEGTLYEVLELPRAFGRSV